MCFPKQSFAIGFVTLVSTLIIVVGCGTKKELNREQNRRQRLETENLQLSKQEERNLRYLQHIDVSDHFQWIVASWPVQRSEAIEICERIGYRLPTLAELEEFKTQVVANYPEKGRSFFDRAISQDGDDMDGIDLAICVLEKDNDSISNSTL